MKRLIINADDFGLSEGVNRGILECFKKGALTSATLMVNTDGFADAARIIRDEPLPTGLHLNVVRGRPISPPEKVPSLVDKSGMFLTLAAFSMRVFFGRISAEELKAEFRAQAGRALDSGVKITHFDSHRHVHLMPFVMEAAISVCRELGINRVRTARVLNAPGRRKSVKEFLLDRSSRMSGARVLKGTPVLTNDYFSDPLSRSGAEGMKELDRFLNALPDGVVEVGCHPGYNGGIALEGESSYDREHDMAVLKEPAFREMLIRHGIRPISYRDLKRAQG